MKAAFVLNDVLLAFYEPVKVRLYKVKVKNVPFLFTVYLNWITTTIKFIIPENFSVVKVSVKVYESLKT